MQNAFCYVLQTKGELEKDDLIRESSRVFGYKRLGNNLEAALTEGLKSARASKSIVCVTGRLYRLP